jgi:hypothetical protein
MAGCASHHRPDYETITDLVPDCANRDAQIRYLSKLKRIKAQSSDDEQLYNRTIDIQIQRLVVYCQ